MNLRTLARFFRSTCPICYSRDVRLSGRRNTRERLLSALFYIRPFRCRDCWSRFWKLESAQRRQGSAPYKDTALHIPQSRFSMAAVFNPVILILSAFSAVFVLMLPEFPTFALYGFIICVIVILTELSAPKLWPRLLHCSFSNSQYTPELHSLLRIVSDARSAGVWARSQSVCASSLLPASPRRSIFFLRILILFGIFSFFRRTGIWGTREETTLETPRKN